MPRQGCRLMALPVLLTWCLLAMAGIAHAQPRQVASLNLCTDQLLLALADRSQIASLSRLARDPAISFLADRAAGLPLNDGSAEAILFSRPGLVLTGTYGQRDRVDLLRREGLDVLQFGPWLSLDEGRRQIRLLAGRLGHADRGEALIAAMDQALERAKGIAPAGRSIMAYERGGWVAAARSHLGEVLVEMGFALHQERFGLGGGGIARLETMVAMPPDVLLVDPGTRRAMDNGTALFAHPALAAAVPPERRLELPGRLTICGGPSTPAMIDALAAGVRSRLRL
ncbi:iron complex transport system substrate-binding protein [Microvirga flocculans]|uniref:Iron complex transport system substrate-binding protein n=1 Tax=Microvirga flocculans TaxID=217168 RepID=A0A7W6IHU8_9HYPH|nr:ABC transporter substrate-binding protein [Microvirga flocculans]MBB4041185.1 iron complex transport system substrate-binding protein [Microvirga flocculans]